MLLRAPATAAIATSVAAISRRRNLRFSAAIAPLSDPSASLAAGPWLLRDWLE